MSCYLVFFLDTFPYTAFHTTLLYRVENSQLPPNLWHKYKCLFPDRMNYYSCTRIVNDSHYHKDLLDILFHNEFLAILAYRCNNQWQDHNLDYSLHDNHRFVYIPTRKILFHNDLDKIHQ